MTDYESAIEAYEERAAIMEYDGGLSKSEAERQAKHHLPKVSAREHALKLAAAMNQPNRPRS